MEHETLVPSRNELPTQKRHDFIYDDAYPERPRNNSRNTRTTNIALCIGLCILSSLAGFLGSSIYTSRTVSNSSHKPPSNPTCTSPPIRHEWRSLSTAAKDAYIDAVLCLRTKPSRLGMNHTLWDDFSYVHFQSNHDIHFAASFLTWHRYLIHIYHAALASECGYAGQLPYWDWTLDWEDLYSAPVWNLEHGFSGNGRESTVPSPHFPRSHCIEDGRLTGVQVDLAGSRYSPHCLTRDFGSFHHEPVANLSQHVRPEPIDDLLRENDYYAFLVKFEDGPHIAIPKFIMSDFRLFTSPNDPIFFIHHAQIDRIWWRWQQYDLPRRKKKYNGKFEPKSEQQASIDDIISIGGLAPDVKVSELMNVQSGLLCYRY